MNKETLQAAVCMAFLLLTAPLATAAQQDSLVRLPGHVLPALGKAKAVAPQSEAVADEPLTLTLVLKRDDPAGFDKYLREVYDPKAPSYRKFLSQTELSNRFGPSREAYERLLVHLQSHGLNLVEGSENRLTLTVRGMRGDVERAFALHMTDYTIGDRRFHANDVDPALPAELASSVQAVTGLSNLAQLHANGIVEALRNFFIAVICRLQSSTQLQVRNCLTIWKNKGLYTLPIPPAPPDGQNLTAMGDAARTAVKTLQKQAVAPPRWQELDGTGQTVGVIAFDTFQMRDVADYLALIRQPATPDRQGERGEGQRRRDARIERGRGARRHQGRAHARPRRPGRGLRARPSPAPAASRRCSTRPINGGSTIITNSWAYCEDQTTLADVQSIDAIFQTAAAAGISIFNAAGDTGSTCLNGSPNTVAVPASAPSATAVGGSTLTTGGPGGTYGERDVVGWHKRARRRPARAASG